MSGTNANSVGEKKKKKKKKDGALFYFSVLSGTS